MWKLRKQKQKYENGKTKKCKPELEKYEKVDEYKEPKIYSLFLHEFYGSDQLESCCIGKVSYPYTMTTGTEFNFPDNYSE